MPPGAARSAEGVPRFQHGFGRLGTGAKTPSALSPAHSSKQQNRVSVAMRLSIDKPSLSRALAHVASVVERRNTIPILSNVLLSIRSNELTLTATDLDMEIVETVPATAKGEGKTTVPAHMLHDIVRKLPVGSDIELQRDGSEGRLTVTSGPAQFS